MARYLHWLYFVFVSRDKIATTHLRLRITFALIYKWFAYYAALLNFILFISIKYDGHGNMPTYHVCKVNTGEPPLDDYYELL